MSQIAFFRSWWGWVVTALLWNLSFTVPVGWAATDGQGEVPAVSQVQENSFTYPVRPGESLSDVAHLFRIPVEELMRFNRIADPTRLRAGQSLQIPNVFARQTAQLQEERDRLLAEKEQMAGELQQRRTAVTTIQADLQRVEAEKTALNSQVASTFRWQQGVLALSLLVVGVVGWGFKLRGERTRLARRLAVLTQETTALQVAKEKYRQAAAQLELRYQKLYRGGAEAPAKFIAEGVTLLTRSFTQGCAQIEQLLTSIKTEREKVEQAIQAEQKALDFLFHPVRGFQQRHRLEEA